MTALRRQRPSVVAVVACAGALAALLALVALASNGGVAGGGSGAVPGGPAGSSTAVAYAYAFFLVGGALAFPFVVYVSVRQTPYSRERRARARLFPFVIVAAAGVALLIASQWREQFGSVLDRISIFEADGKDARPSRPGAAPPRVDPLPIALFASLAVAAIGAVVVRRGVKRRRGVLDSLAGRLSDIIAVTLEDLDAEQDARRAVILAYARMESALRCCGVPRRESETPLEYLARVLLELDVAQEPVSELTRLFEQAKFSNHEIGMETRAAAIAALAAIHADLERVA